MAVTEAYITIYSIPKRPERTTHAHTFTLYQISQRLAKLLAPAGHTVTSIIRDPAQADTIRALPATPLVLSLEDDPAPVFSKAFAGADVVYFSAGAGGKGGEGRTKKIDWEGAVKVFDAIEGVGDVDGGSGKKPMLVLVSAIDVRGPDKVPAHYVRVFVSYMRCISMSLIHARRCV